MKRVIPFIAIFSVLVLSNCEKLALNTIILDNQSDYSVTVSLYTGSTNDDGSMIFEDYTVSSKSKKSVKSETNVVYVDGYSPSGSVDMEISESNRTIYFRNL